MYVQSGWPKTVEDMLLVCYDKCNERNTKQGCLMWGATLVIPKMHQQKVQEEPKLTPLHPWEFPDGPWRRIHVDFGGPFQGKSFLVIVNAYSKWRLWQWMKPQQWMNCVSICIVLKLYVIELIHCIPCALVFLERYVCIKLVRHHRQ